MSRPARHLLNPRSALVGLGVLCVLFAIMPPKWTRWHREFGRTAETLLVPIKHPLRQLVGSSDQEPLPRGFDADDARATRRDRDELLARVYQLERENQSLQSVIRDLQRGIDINPGLAVKQITAPVLGGPTDLSARTLQLRAGRRSGVMSRAVVAARGVHLVGLVIDVGERTAIVQTITDRSAPKQLIGVVMLREGMPGPICQLQERRGRDLIFTVGEGEFHDPATSAPMPIEPGMLVRLRDDSWPLYAEGLIIGRVTSADVNPEIRQRRVITVRPEVDFSTLREVQVRMLDEAAPLPIGLKTTPSGQSVLADAQRREARP